MLTITEIIPEIINTLLLPLDLRLVILIIALAADAVIGEPPWLWRHIPHPVMLFGRGISAMTAWGNKRQFSGYRRRINGWIAIMFLLMASFGAGFLLSSPHAFMPSLGLLIEGVLVMVLLAGRSLHDHVARVAKPLRSGAIDDARFHVSMIVGRNPDQLDEPAIARAAIETTAENLSDGVIAPALFYLVFGLPGIILYKMLNTADSMIGYRSKDFYAFGTASARLDDLANIIPARLTGLLLAISAPTRFFMNFKVMMRDAPKHRSPNAGWPEAAMASALGLSLAGPRQYGQRMSDDHPMNPDGKRQANADDIDKALVLMWRALGLFALCLLGIYII